MIHECPANGCRKAVGAGMLMCRPHWRMVPKDVQARVWGAWSNGRGAGSLAHARAITAAISAVDRKLTAGQP